jgi:hypothetical protein
MKPSRGEEVKAEREARWRAKCKEVHGDRYIYDIAGFSSSKGYVTIICKEHGKFRQVAKEHSRGRGCRMCAEQSRRMSYDKFVELASSVHQDKYKYAGFCRSGRQHCVHVECPTHGRFVQNRQNHLRGSGCEKCGKARLAESITTAAGMKFVSQASDIHGDRYNYGKTVYVSAKKKVVITCTVHGDFLQTPTGHLGGKGCMDCAVDLRAKKKTTAAASVFEKKSRAVHGDKYDYSGSVYLTAKQEIEVRCPDHGSFFVTPDAHIRSRVGCNGCHSISHGEDYIAELLLELGVEFVRQAKFDECKHIGRLAFDFYIKSHNLLIEFDGKQHYEPIEWFGGEKGFLEQVARDNIKNNFAINSGIRLARIPYYSDVIAEVSSLFHGI